MKKTWIIAGIATAILFAVACGGKTKANTGSAGQDSAGTNTTTDNGAATDASNPAGVGKFTSVELTHPLDQKMVESGQKVYDVKCSSCHKLTDEKLVGPGWKGVTTRRKPEWIMNFSTNTEEMLNKDATAMSMLEVCLVRMPNQNLSDEDARAVLEFMRNNDGDK